MVRKAHPAPEQRDDVDHAALEHGANALVSVAGNAAEVTAMMGYDVAYNKDRIVQEARFFMGTAGDAMLEAGKRLVLLKEHEAHGEFTRIVEDQLGLPVRTAQQMMQAAVKYLSHPGLEAKAQTFTLLGKSKMFELMTLDSDVLLELAEGGSVAGITIDEVDRMSVRDLKSALREAREDAHAKDGVLANKSAIIDKLQTKQAKLKPPTQDEEGAQLRRETGDWGFQVEGIIRGSLRDGLAYLGESELENGSNHEDFASGVLAQIERALNDVRSELGIKAAPTGDNTPEWNKTPG